MQYLEVVAVLTAAVYLSVHLLSIYTNWFFPSFCRVRLFYLCTTRSPLTEYLTCLAFIAKVVTASGSQWSNVSVGFPYPVTSAFFQVFAAGLVLSIANVAAHAVAQGRPPSRFWTFQEFVSKGFHSHVEKVLNESSKLQPKVSVRASWILDENLLFKG